MSVPTKKPGTETPPQRDQGYDASHGYGPGHGGPSGPGDAPADPKKAPPVPRDPSEDVDDDAPLP